METFKMTFLNQEYTFKKSDYETSEYGLCVVREIIKHDNTYHICYGVIRKDYKQVFALHEHIEGITILSEEDFLVTEASFLNGDTKYTQTHYKVKEGLARKVASFTGLAKIVSPGVLVTSNSLYNFLEGKFLLSGFLAISEFENDLAQVWYGIKSEAELPAFLEGMYAQVLTCYVDSSGHILTPLISLNNEDVFIQGITNNYELQEALMNKGEKINFNKGRDILNLYRKKASQDKSSD